MKKYFILIGFIGLFITGCVQEPRPPHVKPVVLKPVIQAYSSAAMTSTTRAFPVSGFDSVVISGPINATITGHKKQNLITMTGQIDPTKNTFESNVKANINNGVLYISGKDNVTLDLAQPLQKLMFMGNGRLTLNDVGNQSMMLTLGGNSATNMIGDLVLSRIELSGNALLHAYWVNSTNLHIVAKDHAKLFLAGIVTELDIIAGGDANIDAKYLRVDNSYVRTTENADVGVTVKHAMSSFSTGKSTVYYYRDSDVGMHYLNNAGSALRMKGIPDNRN